MGIITQNCCSLKNKFKLYKLTCNQPPSPGNIQISTLSFILLWITIDWVKGITITANPFLQEDFRFVFIFSALRYANQRKISKFVSINKIINKLKL